MERFLLSRYTKCMLTLAYGVKYQRACLRCFKGQHLGSGSFADTNDVFCGWEWRHTEDESKSGVQEPMHFEFITNVSLMEPT
jgi:hypothetical protein